MTKAPTFEFHISRDARERYQLAASLFSITGNVVLVNMAAVREFARRMNELREAAEEPPVPPGALNAMGVIDEALHRVLARYRAWRDPRSMLDALSWFEGRFGHEALDRVLLRFTDEFPAAQIFRGERSPEAWLADSTSDVSHRAVALEELMMLWLANANPAFKQFEELFADKNLSLATAYPQLTSALRDYFETRPRFGPDNQNVVDLLRAPATASPDSLAGQLAFMRDKWPELLGDFIDRLLTALDIHKEEEIAVWLSFHPPRLHGGGWMQGDSSAAAIPSFAEYEYERFSQDVDWMPRTVLIAKSVYVWLHQLSGAYRRQIYRLDHVPDEELDTLALRGFNALWLIGVWERSNASQRIKQMTGNPEAAASAYSLYDYIIARDLGGEDAFDQLRDRAWQRGIRMASDMVPNHMGIDSRWVIQHPDWFLSLPYPPFHVYSYHGPDLCDDGRVEIKIEDHYYDRNDAAVVFRRSDRWTSDARFIYHGNDGTSFPWNDTAQLNYLKAEVREAVIQTILSVARRFPIIRFDAAMTLTKQHYQRLWFPAPGSGGAIPSRSEHGLTKQQFDAAMPHEFWRELVDRVAAEVPGTLLLAEAFWLLEGYFVRTLGMHRVYNSAFMNMLRDEENANYRNVIKKTLEFDPDVLKRYVNFMNNPDERTAIDQFGKGDKYFGICTMMATLPGLPMFGHGQVEGYTERYGMEYRCAYRDETPDLLLVARHEREISPLLYQRALFAEVAEFLLYDFFTDEGWVNEDVFAYSNRLGGQRGLIVYHNRYAETHGRIHTSCAYAEKLPDGSRRLRRRTLGESFGLSRDQSMYLAYREAVTGLEYLQRAADVAEKGLRLELNAFKTHVYLDWRDLQDDSVRPWGALCDLLGGRGVSSLDDELLALEQKPAHDALRGLMGSSLSRALAREALRMRKAAVAKKRAAKKAASKTIAEAVAAARDQVRRFIAEARRFAASPDGQAAGLAPADEWIGDVDSAVQRFESRVHASLRLPAVLCEFSDAARGRAREVLPAGEGELPQPALFAGVLAWCALEALAQAQDPAAPEFAAVQLFDGLRLRGPMAESFAALGSTGEEQWRAAARVRAAFAHAPWAVGAEKLERRATAPLSWERDPDVAWLIRINEHQGTRYFNKEEYERLLWWMLLPSLLVMAESEVVEVEAVRALERQLAARCRAAANAAYRVEFLGHF